MEAVSAQCEVVKQQWLKRLFSSVSDLILTRYVHFHQAAVTALSDKVSQIPASVPLPETFPHAIIRQLELLVDFLKDTFHRYFDKRHPMSLARSQATAAEISLRLDDTLQNLRKADVDDQLISVIQTTITGRIADAHQLSFQHAELIVIALKRIDEAANRQAAQTTTSIAHELHLQNFNAYPFTAWHQEFLAKLLKRATDDMRADLLEREITFLENIYPDTDRAFDPDLPSSSEQVLRWLRKLAQPAKEQIIVPGKAAPERLPLLCSVPQFAFFVRLCYLEGSFPVQNISALFRFFTSHFETKKQAHVSVKSFGRAFYTTDQGTAAVVRDLLQRMIHTINKTYFP